MTLVLVKRPCFGGDRPSKIKGIGAPGMYLVNVLDVFSKFSFHQEFQVPKMEVLNLVRLFWGWVFPYP